MKHANKINQIVMLILLCQVGLKILSASADSWHKPISERPDETEDINAMLVNQIEEAGGNHDFVGLSANEIINKLEDSSYATVITKEAALQYTNKGATVIVGLKGNPKGMVAEVYPETMLQTKTSWGLVPYIFKAGETHPVPLTTGFSPSQPLPKFYIRNIDLKVISERK